MDISHLMTALKNLLKPELTILISEAFSIYDDRLNIEKVKNIVDTLKKNGMGFKRYCFAEDFQFKKYLKASKPGETIIGAGDTVIELGHPVTSSICMSLITDRDDIVANGMVTVVGSELQKLKQK